ncbi:MAG TPA: hypothetical protein DCS81_00535 [Pantoea septica]|nr:hypothetical protein [Pantoea septica]
MGHGACCNRPGLSELESRCRTPAGTRRRQSFTRDLTLSGTKTHVKQRFLLQTPLLTVSDVLWSPVLPA